MPDFCYDHVHLISPDPLKTSAFYENMFGARRANVADTEMGTMVRLEIGTSVINIMPPRKRLLLPSSSRTAYGIEHFGLRTDNLMQAVANLKAKDVRFALDIIEPQPGFKTSFLVAPEDVLIELFEDKN